MMCSRCLGDISGVIPVDSAARSDADDVFLILRTDDGKDIRVHDGMSSAEHRLQGSA